MTVCIYNGPGASQMDAKILEFMFSMAFHPHGIPVKMIGIEEINSPNARWQQEGNIIVFGGGEFSRLKQKLSDYGRSAIRSFTASKKYLGICFGAYAGASQIEFFGKDCYKTSDGWGYFNGVARGSLPIAPALYTGKSDSAQLALFHHEKYDIDFPSLYWGGPYFDLSHPATAHAEALTTLKNPASDHVITMGIKVPVEQGSAILLGYHPEAMQHYIRKWVLQFCEEPHDIERIERDMSRHESWKFYIGFACLLDDLNIVKGHSFLHQILNPPSPMDHMIKPAPFKPAYF